MSGEHSFGQQQEDGATTRHHSQNMQNGAKAAQQNESTHDGQKKTGAMSDQDHERRIKQLERLLYMEQQRGLQLLRRIQKLEAAQKQEEQEEVSLTLSDEQAQVLYYALVNHVHLVREQGNREAHQHVTSLIAQLADQRMLK